MNNGIIEWQQLARSIRYSNERFDADVWPFMTTKKVFKYTVIDRSNGHYVDCGMATSQNDACEKALLAMNE